MSLPIHIQFVQPDEKPNEEHLLARVVFQSPFQSPIPQNDKPYLIQTGLRQVSETSICEDWLSATPVQHGQYNNVTYANNNQILFGQVSLDQHLSLDTMTFDAYTRTLKTLTQTSYRHLLRVWHYLPNINGLENNISRYHLFCRGRNKAFGENTAAQRCAATVIGTQATKPAMFFIAARTGGEAIENPQQTPPWEYPDFVGTDKPVFARAIKAHNLSMLFISGTASIIGSHSQHIDNAEAQVKQIFEHFKTLLQAIPNQSSFCFECLKVYLRSADTNDSVRAAIAHISAEFNIFPKRIIVFEGEVCRPELMLEMEALVSYEN